jgi:mono/diheme cytochrome c family protein
MIKSFFWGLLLVLCLNGSVTASEGDFVQFQKILDTKCSQCHTRVRIEDAMHRGENFNEIIEKMIRFGAQLSSQEQEVLGVFWNAPDTINTAASPAGRTVSADPLGEFRAVLESRCTGCHDLGPVERAMMQGRSVDDLIELMRQRGAVVTEADKKVLGTFWGDPLKDKPK